MRQKMSTKISLNLGLSGRQLGERDLGFEGSRGGWPDFYGSGQRSAQPLATDLASL